MTLVLITADGPEHRYVANRILAEHELAAIYLCTPSPKRKWHKVLRQSPVRFVDKVTRQLYLKLVKADAARKASLARVLGPDSTAFSRPDLLVDVGRPKAGVLLENIKSLSPDIIAVYGTGIIPDDVLYSAGNIALNMHTGLSPWYRGTACAFWPIAESEPDKVGATVHECTADLDGGRIFARSAAKLFRDDDDLGAVFARAVQAGAADYVSVIAKAKAGPLSGEAQDMTIGREYRGSDLTLKAEMKARRNLARLSLTWPKA